MTFSEVHGLEVSIVGMLKAYHQPPLLADIFHALIRATDTDRAPDKKAY